MDCGRGRPEHDFGPTPDPTCGREHTCEASRTLPTTVLIGKPLSVLRSSKPQGGTEMAKKKEPKVQNWFKELERKLAAAQ